MELIDTFFERLCSLPVYSFLHLGITKERFVEGTLEECLLFALCAITALCLANASLITGSLKITVGRDSRTSDLARAGPSLNSMPAGLVVMYQLENGHPSI
jgi:hypothetical protein